MQPCSKCQTLHGPTAQFRQAKMFGVPWISIVHLLPPSEAAVASVRRTKIALHDIGTSRHLANSYRRAAASDSGPTRPSTAIRSSRATRPAWRARPSSRSSPPGSAGGVGAAHEDRASRHRHIAPPGKLLPPRGSERLRTHPTRSEEHTSELKSRVDI